MIYEGVWLEGIEKDLSVLTEEEQDELIAKFESILKAPNPKTKRVKQWRGNIRKIRFHKYRLFIYVSEPEEATVYAMALRPRKKCYDNLERKEVERFMKKIAAFDAVRK